jgi:hypothetical protein
MDRIFFPMVSGHPGGTGLGLPIAQELINQHGGLIECESRPGSTRFFVYLPLEAAMTKIATGLGHRRRPLHPLGAGAGAAQGRDGCDQLLQRRRRHGRLQRERPDVILSDIRMPGIDGLDLLQQINGSDTRICRSSS